MLETRSVCTGCDIDPNMFKLEVLSTKQQISFRFKHFGHRDKTPRNIKKGHWRPREGALTFKRDVLMPGVHTKRLGRSLKKETVPKLLIKTRLDQGSELHLDRVAACRINGDLEVQPVFWSSPMRYEVGLGGRRAERVLLCAEVKESWG